MVLLRVLFAAPQAFKVAVLQAHDNSSKGCDRSGSSRNHFFIGFAVMLLLLSTMQTKKEITNCNLSGYVTFTLIVVIGPIHAHVYIYSFNTLWCNRLRQVRIEIDTFIKKHLLFIYLSNVRL